MDTWKTVQSLIAQEKIKKGAFAAKMNISRTTLDSWLKEATAPDQKDIKKMSEILDGIVGKLDAHKGMEPEDIYRNIVEGNTEYILIPRTVLQEKYRLVAIEQLEKDKAQI